MPETLQKLPSFQLRLPEVSTRKVWVGFSSNDRGTTITILSRRPVMDEARGEYDIDFESQVAEIWVAEWEAWFGSLQPFADAGLIEHGGEETGWVTLPKQSLFEKVMPINLTTAWRDDEHIVGLNLDAYN